MLVAVFSIIRHMEELTSGKGNEKSRFTYTDDFTEQQQGRELMKSHWNARSFILGENGQDRSILDDQAGWRRSFTAFTTASDGQHKTQAGIMTDYIAHYVHEIWRMAHSWISCKLQYGYSTIKITKGFIINSKSFTKHSTNDTISTT